MCMPRCFSLLWCADCDILQACASCWWLALRVVGFALVACVSCWWLGSSFSDLLRWGASFVVVELRLWWGASFVVNSFTCGGELRLWCCGGDLHWSFVVVGSFVVWTMWWAAAASLWWASACVFCWCFSMPKTARATPRCFS